MGAWVYLCLDGGHKVIMKAVLYDKTTLDIWIIHLWLIWTAFVFTVVYIEDHFISATLMYEFNSLQNKTAEWSTFVYLKAKTVHNQQWFVRQ